MILDTTILEIYDDVMSTSKVYDCLPIIYPILGLNGEAGEAAEKVKKCLRDNKGNFDEETKNAIKKELADVLWYIWAAADDMDTSLDEIMSIGIKKVKERQETNTVHGSGDDREEILILSKYIDNSYREDKLSKDNHYDNEPYRQSILEGKIIIKLNGNFDSLKKITYTLSYSRNKTVHIKLRGNNKDDIYEYDAEYHGISRIDGGLLLSMDDNVETKEFIKKVKLEFPYYQMEINGDLLYDRRIEEIPIVYNKLYTE